MQRNKTLALLVLGMTAGWVTVGRAEAAIQPATISATSVDAGSSSGSALTTTQSIAAPPSVLPAVVLPNPGPLPIKFTGVIQVWEVLPQAKGEVATTRLRVTEFQARGEVGDHASWWLKIDPATVKEDDGKTGSFSNTATGKISSAVSSTGRKSILQDAVVAYDRPFPDVPWLKRLQVGQFKTPFGMEALMPTSHVDTAERSMMSSQLRWSNQRDLGGMVNMGTGRFDLWAGGFNGEVQNVHDVNNYTNINVRATFRVSGWLVIGGAWQGGRIGLSKDLNDHAGAEMACTWHLGGVPICLKGEFAHGVRGPRGKATAGRTAYGVLGIGIWPDVFELVGKEDWLDPGVLAAGDWRTETTAGLNWFLLGHQAKVQLNYVRVDEPTPKVVNDFIRINVQTSF